MTEANGGRQPDRLVLGVVLVVLLAMPVTILYVGVTMALRAASTERHVVVKGVVIASGVEEIRDAGARIGEPTTSTYRPRVHYTYIYDGHTRAAERVTQFGESSTRAWAAAVASQYMPGRTISVHVDPEHPDEAYLEPGAASILPWVVVLLGGIPCATALWLAGQRLLRAMNGRAQSEGRVPRRFVTCGAASRLNTKSIALAILVMFTLLLGLLLRPVCVPLTETDLLDFNVPIERRVDRDVYLRVFQKRDNQWYQCKTWLSRKLFF